MRRLACAMVVIATAPWPLTGQSTEMVQVSVTVPPVVTLSPASASADFTVSEGAEGWVEGRSPVVLTHAGNVDRVVEVRGFRVVVAPAAGVGVPVEVEARVQGGSWAPIQGDTRLGSSEREEGRGTVTVHHRIRGTAGPLPPGVWAVEIQYGVRAAAEP